MLGWYIAAITFVIAAVAVGIVWRRHRRDIRQLRSSHDNAVRQKDDEHRRQLQRINREHDRRLESAHHPLVRDLLPVIDSLDEAVAHVDDTGDADEADIHQGLELAREALYDALERHDITPIAPTSGDSFDPELHEAISRREDGEQPSGTIHQRFRRGYRDGQRVLRSALVEVYVDPDPSPEVPETASSESDAEDSDDHPFDDGSPPASTDDRSSESDSSPDESSDVESVDAPGSDDVDSSPPSPSTSS